MRARPTERGLRNQAPSKAQRDQAPSKAQSDQTPLKVPSRCLNVGLRLRGPQQRCVLITFCISHCKCCMQLLRSGGACTCFHESAESVVLLRLQRYMRINDLWNVALNTWLALRVSDLRVCRARALSVLLTPRSWSLNSTLIEVSSSPCAADPFSEGGGGLGEEMADARGGLRSPRLRTPPDLPSPVRGPEGLWRRPPAAAHRIKPYATARLFCLRGGSTCYAQQSLVRYQDEGMGQI